MSKLIFEMDLSNDESEKIAKIYMSAPKMAAALYDIFNLARNQLKYNDIEDPKTIAAFEDIKELSMEFMY